MNSMRPEDQDVLERQLSLAKPTESVPATASKEPDALYARLVEHANSGDCEDIVWDNLGISIQSRRGGVIQAASYVFLRSEVSELPLALAPQDGCLLAATDPDTAAGESSDADDAQFASALGW